MMSRKTRILLSFACVYLLWGSTYLGIRLAVREIPPFLLVGIRFLVAGTLLQGIDRMLRRGVAPVTLGGPRRNRAALSGTLFAFSNGLLCRSEATIPSGTAALWICTVPACIVLLNWLFFERKAPGARVIAGMAFGCLGVALLSRGGGVGDGPMPISAQLTLLCSNLFWSLGILCQRGNPDRSRPLAIASLQMLAGGTVLLALGLLTGEWSLLAGGSLSTRAVLALGYLVIFGSVIGFTAFSWLVANVAPQYVATYALVNPLVALVLGIVLLGEPTDRFVALGCVTILTGVTLILEPGSGVKIPKELRRSDARSAISVSESVT